MKPKSHSGSVAHRSGNLRSLFHFPHAEGLCLPPGISGRPPRSLNPRHAACSPGHRAISPAHRVLSPGQLARSAGQLSRSPGHRTLSPGQLPNSPGDLSCSPGQLSGSPAQLAGSPEQLAGSPAHLAISPGVLGCSPGRLDAPNASEAAYIGQFRDFNAKLVVGRVTPCAPVFADSHHYQPTPGGQGTDRPTSHFFR